MALCEAPAPLLKVQKVFGPLVTPFSSTSNDVLPIFVNAVVDLRDTIQFYLQRCPANLLKVVVDHVANFIRQQGFGPKGCPSLQTGVRACKLLCEPIRLPLHCKFPPLNYGWIRVVNPRGWRYRSERQKKDLFCLVSTVNCKRPTQLDFGGADSICTSKTKKARARALSTDTKQMVSSLF